MIGNNWLQRVFRRRRGERSSYLGSLLTTLGLAALVIPLVQPLLPTPKATPTAEAADLGWSDGRPPLTSVSDTAPPFKALEPFGSDVPHAIVTAPNGDLFTSGNGPGGSSFAFVYKSVDGGQSWRDVFTLCLGDILDLRVLPGYGAPTNPDNTLLALCSNPARPILISRDAGHTWSGSPALASPGATPVSFAVSPDFTGPKGGIALVGTTGAAAARSERTAFDGSIGMWREFAPMPEAGGSDLDSALALEFPPGFATAALPAGSAGAGAVWSDPTNVSKKPTSSDKPDIAVESDGTAHAVWQECCPNSNEIFYATKAPGGAWSAPINVSNSGANDFSPSIAVDSSGTVHVLWERCCGSQIIYATKTRTGSFSTPSVVPGFSAGRNPSIAIDASGALHAAWTDAAYCSDEVVYASKAPGGNWTSATIISNLCTNARNADIAVDDGGGVHVAWQMCCPSGQWDIQYVTRPAGGGFSSPVNVSNTSSFSSEPAITARGGVHIVWQEDIFGNDEILYATRGSTGSFSAPRNISNTFGASLFPDIAADSEGIHVVFADCCPTGGNWDILYVTLPPGGNWSAPENISETNGFSFEPAIAAGAAGLAAAWRDDTPGNSEIFAATGVIGPSIKLEPAAGKPGDTVTVKGRNFRKSAAAAVNFNGVEVATATVNVTPTSLVKVSGDAQSGTVATALAGDFVVELRDNLGAPVGGATVSFTITGAPAGATGQDIDPAAGAQNSVLVTTTTAAPAGRASAKLTPGDKSGTYTVRASSGGVPDATFTATANPGAATTVLSAGGPGVDFQTAKVGTKLPAPFTAIVVDSKGNGVSGKEITFTISSPTGATGQDIDQATAGAQSALKVTTGADGKAAATLTLGDTLGSYSVTAVSDLNANATIEANETVTFFAMATSLQPTKVVLTSGNGQTATVGTALVSAFSVTVRDSAQLAVNNALVRFTITEAPAGATGQDIDQATSGAQSGFSATTNVNGVASATLTLGDKSGVYKVSATVGLNLVVTFTATANPGAAASLNKVLGDNQTGLLVAPLAQSLVVKVRDAKGNGVPGKSVTFTIASVPTGAVGQNLLVGPTTVGLTATVSTNANGEAAANPVLGNIAGAYTVNVITDLLGPTAGPGNDPGETVTFTATGTDKITLPEAAAPSTPLPPPPGGFTATFTVPTAGPGTHLVEAIGKKAAGGAVSGDKAAALFSIGNIIRIYWHAGNRIEEQGAPLLGTWPAPGSAGALQVAATAAPQGPVAGDRGAIRLPSGATSLAEYWLALNLHGQGAPGDVYRRVGGAAPAFVDTNVGGAATASAVAGLDATGPFSTGTVVAGVGSIPKVFKSTNGGTTWGAGVALDQGRGEIGAGEVRVAMSKAFSTDSTLYSATSGKKGGVHKSADSNATWRDAGLTNEPYNVIRSMPVRFDTTAFAVTVNRNGPDSDRAVFRTTNFGPNAVWERVDRRDGVGSLFFPAGIPAPSDTTAVVYARRFGVTTEQALKSTNSGLSFAPTAANPGPNPVRSLAAISATLLFAGSETGRVFRSADGGVTWTESTTDLGDAVFDLDPGPDFAFNPSAVAPAPTTTGAFFATAQATASGMEVFVSNDAGVTFTKVGSSAGAWGPGASSLNLSVLGTAAAGYTLFVRPRGATNNDIFRATLDLAAPAAALWQPLGAPPNVKGAAGFNSMFVSTSLSSGIGEGVVMYLMGRAPNGEDVNTVWRTYFPKSVTASTWKRDFLPGVPVDCGSVLGCFPNNPPFNSDVTITSFRSDSTLGRQLVALDFNVPTRVLTWTDTKDFLTPPAATEPVDLATFFKGDKITLRWNTVPLATIYQFEVAKDDKFLTRVQTFSGTTTCGPGGFTFFDPLAPATEGTTATISAFNLEDNQTYFWRMRVCAVNSNGESRLYPGPWNPTRSFRVERGAAINLTPSSGFAGVTEVSFTGQRFLANEIVEVTWDNPFKMVGAFKTDATGSFPAALKFTVPAGAPIGPHIVRARGIESFRAAAAIFEVLSPTPAGAATFTGKVQIGTTAAPQAPPPGYAILVKIFPAGKLIPQFSPLVQTDGTGVFSVTIKDLPAGSYDIEVKGHHTLSNKKSAVALPDTGTTSINFGVLRTGDLDISAASENLIQGVDYSIMVTNFGTTAPLVVAAATSQISLKLSPDFQTASEGEIIKVDVVAEAGLQSVDAVDVYMAFNPSVLQIVDESEEAASYVSPSSALPIVLRNEADNEGGRIAYTAGRAPGRNAPNGDFVVATLYFRTLVAISSEALPVALLYDAPTQTGAYFRGRSLVSQ